MYLNWFWSMSRFHCIFRSQILTDIGLPIITVNGTTQLHKYTIYNLRHFIDPLHRP